jgi:hypothetical protein
MRFLDIIEQLKKIQNDTGHASFFESKLLVTTIIIIFWWSSFSFGDILYIQKYTKAVTKHYFENSCFDVRGSLTIPAPVDL